VLNRNREDVQKQQEMQKEACSKWLRMNEDLTYKRVLNSSVVT
jgi:hypothetical protein